MKFILPKIFLGMERWKWNKEYRVYVSNMGHFKDEYKEDLPFKTTSSGYLNVKTRCGYKLAHRLVMLTWRPIPGAEDLTVDHLDHNKRNNALSNLEWVTREENLRRADEDYLEDKVADIPVVKVKVKVTPKKKKQKTVIERDGSVKKFKTLAEAATWAMQTLPELKGNKDIKKDRIKNKIKNAYRNDTQYLGFMWEIESVEKCPAAASKKVEEPKVEVTIDQPEVEPQEEQSVPVEVIVDIDEEILEEYDVQVFVYTWDDVLVDTFNITSDNRSNAPPKKVRDGSG